MLSTFSAKKPAERIVTRFAGYYPKGSGNDFTPVKKPYFTGILPIVYAFWQQNGNIIWIIVKVKS